MDKALPARDALALKILRNLAANGGCAVASLFQFYMDDLASILQVRNLGPPVQEVLKTL